MKELKKKVILVLFSDVLDKMSVVNELYKMWRKWPWPNFKSSSTISYLE
jgi:hypothetical protein